LQGGNGAPLRNVGPEWSDGPKPGQEKIMAMKKATAAKAKKPAKKAAKPAKKAAKKPAKKK
jgi:hypothetical protein